MALGLRKRGWTYREIAVAIGVVPETASHVVRTAFAKRSWIKRDEKAKGEQE